MRPPLIVQVQQLCAETSAYRTRKSERKRGKREGCTLAHRYLPESIGSTPIEARRGGERENAKPASKLQMGAKIFYISTCKPFRSEDPWGSLVPPRKVLLCRQHEGFIVSSATNCCEGIFRENPRWILTFDFEP